MPVNRKTISTIEQIGGASLAICRNLERLVCFLGEVTQSAFRQFRHPRKIRWRETLSNMNSCGVDALPITLLICFLMGVILGYQSAVQMHRYGADSFLPILVGCSIVRELGPLMVAIVVTGRSGSAFAAEIGTMKISEELDAMVTMGFDPIRFLVMPKLIAMVAMIPLLVVLGDLFGVIGGFLVGHFELGMTLENYYQITQAKVLPKYFFEGLSKSVVFAVIITIVGCWRGFETGNDAVAVGRSTTSSVVISILFIIIADTILAKFFTFLFMGVQ